jgi:LemA protein
MEILVVLGIAAAVLIFLVAMYNRLIAMKRLTENAWADVDVYLKRRSELVPNLVEAVKGASAYEQGTLERVVQARSNAMAVHQPTAEKAAAESELTTGIVRAVAIAEAYPDLKANQNFLKLQSELSDAERLIASARQYYNACVRDYNIMIEQFPQSVVAQAAGMKQKNFFEIEDITERDSPGVKGL